jgi:uncharacterized protein
LGNDHPQSEQPRLLEKYIRFVLKHRVAVLICCALLSLISIASLSRAVIASSIGKLFLGESPQYKYYLDKGQRFGSDEILILGIDDKDYLVKDNQRRLKEALEYLQELPFVRRVDSILTARRLETGESILSSPSYASLALESPNRIEELKEQLASEPLYSGTLVDKDGQSIVVLVELTQDNERSAEQAPNIVKGIRSAFANAGYKDSQIHIAGLTVVLAEVISETLYNLTRIFPITATLLLLTVWLLFRRLWPATLALGVAALGVLWTMGVAIELDHQVNVMMSGIPIIILIVAFSDVVHLCSAYLIELDTGKDKETAIIDASKDVGRACLYTSLTTFVGFAGMSFVPTPVFRLLGITLGLGVAIALLQAVTLVPIIFSYMKRPKALRKGPTTPIQNALDQTMIAMQEISLRYPWRIIAIFAVVLGLSLHGISKIRIETDLAKRLDENNRVRLDQDWFARRYSGSNFLDLYVQAPSKSSLIDPQWIKKLYQFERLIEQNKNIDKAQSYVDIFSRLHKTTITNKDSILPNNRKSIAQLLFILQKGTGRDMRRLVDLKTGLIRIMVRVKASGFRQTAIAGQSTLKSGRALFSDGTKLRATGLTYILGDWLDNIIAGQKVAMLVSLSVITLMMVICFRSLSVGLWSMIPNLLPLFAIGGWVGLMWDKVDSDTLTIGLLAIGIGVDDTIHFLSRYRVELNRGHEPAKALRQTFAFAGRAIIMTTLIFVIGVLPFVSSSYFTTRLFGTLLPLSLIVALLADLLLVPSMAIAGVMRFPRTKNPR